MTTTTASSPSLKVGFLLYPDVTQLDLTGPAEVLGQIPGARVHTVWKTLEPVRTSAGFSISPTHTLEGCPDLDILCVPGGSGRLALMEDEELHNFLRAQSRCAKYVTSVCTGSLILAAAGPFRGKRVACHWAYADLVSSLGARFVDARVVRDGHCISGGGVTAGIDFGLALAAEIVGEDLARQIQLSLEYAPCPPYNSGSPNTADPELVARVRKEMRGGQAKGLNYISPGAFLGSRAWEALDVANMRGVSVRLHWTDQPYHWHVNQGQEVFVVLEGCVDMHLRDASGQVHVTRMQPGMIAHAHAGVEHVAHPIVESRVLVVEQQGSE